MTAELPPLEALALKKARAVYASASVTGYLFGVYVRDGVCFGRVYDHVRADPETGRFSDGHLMYTSAVVKVFDKDQILAVATLNSFYVCVTFENTRTSFMSHFETLPKPSEH